MRPIDGLIARFEAAQRPLLERGDDKRHFHGLYLRNTVAVRDELDRGGFADPAWVQAWDVVFAELYLDALERWERGLGVARPWALAFAAAEGPRLPPLRHQLVGLNAHLNYDLPQALLAVVSDEELADPALVRRRQVDFHRIDDIVVRRVPEEYRLLLGAEQPGDRTVFDRLLYPLNKAASRRWLTEARRKVWRNAMLLSDARRDGSGAYAARLAELEQLAAVKVAELLAPGQVLLRLAVRGFGVALPSAPEHRRAAS